MNFALAMWFLLGALAGGTQAWHLWRSCQPASRVEAGLLLRMLLISLVLFAAAIWDGLLPVVVGWASAFFASTGWIAIRSPR